MRMKLCVQAVYVALVASHLAAVQAEAEIVRFHRDSDAPASLPVVPYGDQPVTRRFVDTPLAKKIWEKEHLNRGGANGLSVSVASKEVAGRRYKFLRKIDQVLVCCGGKGSYTIQARMSKGRWVEVDKNNRIVRAIKLPPRTTDSQNEHIKSQIDIWEAAIARCRSDLRYWKDELRRTPSSDRDARGYRIWKINALERSIRRYQDKIVRLERYRDNPQGNPGGQSTVLPDIPSVSGESRDKNMLDGMIEASY